MHRFVRRAPLDMTEYPEPPAADRTGPPLTQGFLFTVLATVAADDFSPEALAAMDRINPNAWYHGQLLETMLNEAEDRDPSLPHALGRNIYYMFRDLLEGFGVGSTAAVIASLPQLWTTSTRGDSGVWRTELVGLRQGHIEAEQPYNCRFEEGAVRGFLESFEASEVMIEHRQCMRSGAPFCTFEVSWED